MIRDIAIRRTSKYDPIFIHGWGCMMTVDRDLATARPCARDAIMRIGNSYFCAQHGEKLVQGIAGMIEYGLYEIRE